MPTRKIRLVFLALLLGSMVPVPVTAQEVRQELAAPGLASSLLDRAKAFLGTPYRYGGRSPKGFDCSGFVSFVFETTTGIALPRSSVLQARQGESIDLDEIQPGDLLFFKTRGKRNRISHVGIYLGEGQFIHASSWGGPKRRRVKISELEGRYHLQRLASARRILGPTSAILELPQQVMQTGVSALNADRLEP